MCASRAHATERAWLFEQLRPFVGFHIAGLFCVLFVSILTLINPLIMKWLIDSVLPARQWRLLSVAAFLFGSAYALELTLYWIANLISVSAVQRMVLQIRIRLLQHLQRLDMSYHESTSTGDILFRLEQDVDQVGELLGEVVPSSLRLVFMTVCSIAAMLFLSPRLTCLILPLVPVFLILHQRYRNILQTRSEAVQGRAAERSSCLQEFVAAIVQIQLLGRERTQSRKFASIAAGAVRAVIKREQSAMYFSVSTMMVVIAGMTIILGYGGYQVMLGLFTVGGLVAFYGYMAGLFGPLGTAADLYSRVHRIGASVRRILEVENRAPAVQNRAGATILSESIYGRIRFQQVSFSYSSRSPVLSDVTIEVQPAETVAIVGQSGSGKSSLAKLIARLYDVSTGTICIDDIDIRDIDLESLRSRVSLVMQEPTLFSGTLRENLLMGCPDAPMTELEEAARIAQLTPVVEAALAGWNQPLGSRGSGLSAGERQRVALARVLLQRRPILILDEATSALDAPTEAAFLHALRYTHPSTTILVISHREAVARWADRVIVLVEGRIVAQGSHAELNHEGSAYYNLWRERSLHSSLATPLENTSEVAQTQRQAYA